MLRGPACDGLSAGTRPVPRRGGLKQRLGGPLKNFRRPCRVCFYVERALVRAMSRLVSTPTRAETARSDRAQSRDRGWLLM